MKWPWGKGADERPLTTREKEAIYVNRLADLRVLTDAWNADYNVNKLILQRLDILIEEVKRARTP